MGVRNLDLLVIHASATPNGQWRSAVDLDNRHVDRGLRRCTAGLWRSNPNLLAIGYHWVIYLNGARAAGRHPDEVGAHCPEQGANRRGLGLCLIGTDQFTLDQWAALADQVAHLCDTHRIPRQFAHAGNGYKGVCGHRDLGAPGACPGFDVAAWLQGGLKPPAEHVLTPEQTP